MKIRTQKAMFPNKELRAVISKEKKISKNWFAWNVLTHPQKELWIPVYLKALEEQMQSGYKYKAQYLLAKFIEDHKRIVPSEDLPLNIIEQVEKVARIYTKRNSSSKTKAIKELDRMHLPVGEYGAKAKDRHFIAEMKEILHVATKQDPKIRKLKSKLRENMDLSHDAARIVDLPNCQKTLLVPHPHTDKHVGLYFQSALDHKAKVLITLCSPYEHPEIIPFWEDRKVKDAEGRTITCTKISERLLYQSPNVATIRDEKRAKLAVEEGGIKPDQFFPRIVERRLSLERGQERHETVHLHYENWPDHQEAPDIDALHLLYAHRDSLAAPNDVVMLNCKATIGRSGLFFYTDLGRRRISAMANDGVPFSDMKLNFAQMVREVRQFRPILSGNLTQFGQAFELISRHYNELKIKRV